jgi:hypothetical protein
MHRFRFVLYSILILSIAPLPAEARTWLVQPDGGGDAPTIAAAIDSVAGNDIIKLADGLYTGEGNRDLYNMEKSIVISSSSGDPLSCVIDCEGSALDPHFGIRFYGGG